MCYPYRLLSVIWWYLSFEFIFCFRLEHLEEDIISNGVKLIVLDSIASLVRKEFDTRTTSNITERTALLSKEAMLLK